MLELLLLPTFLRRFAANILYRTLMSNGAHGLTHCH